MSLSIQCDGNSFPKSWVGGMAIAASCQFMDHLPHPCAWAPGKPGPIQIHMLLYRPWPWIEPLIDWRTHTINNNTSCMPLQGTTKPSPFDWLAIMSKNQLKCTKQLLCRVNIMSKQKTSSVIMSVLWVGRVKTVDAFSMRRRDWFVFLLWVMR